MKQVKDYPNYFVSADGVVLGARGTVLSPDKNKSGYYRVTLSKDGRTKRVFVHKLVAQHWVPNPNDLPIVNHLDGNKLNNSASNLEWTTHRDNLSHALSTGLRTMPGRSLMDKDTKSECERLLLLEQHTYQHIADTLGVTYNAVALTNRKLKERATTIPQGSTSQANGDGSAQPSQEVMI